MATINQLLVDSDGGIINHAAQSDRAPGAHIIIGLGGTGTDAVMRIKKEMYRQLKPDDVEAVVPTYI